MTLSVIWLRNEGDLYISSQLTVGVASKVILQKHRRSLAASGRWVPLSLPPSVGQRGRPRVAGGERNTTPRQRKGGWESTKWVSEWKKKKSVPEREEQSWYFCPFLKRRCFDRRWGWGWWCGGRIDHATSLQRTGRNFRLVAFRCSSTDRRQHDSSKLRPAPFRPGRLDSPPTPERLGATFRIRSPVLKNKHSRTQQKSFSVDVHESSEKAATHEKVSGVLKLKNQRQ